MSDLPTITVWQPWASLIATGVKTIETRSWSTKHRGRIGIHAAKRVPEPHLGPMFVGEFHVAQGGTWLHGPGHDAPMAFGALVATAVLRDVVIIGRCHDPYAPEVPEFALAVSWREDRAWHVVGDTAADETDQLPYGDYAPGRFAWLLEDIKPTTERCPACWGTGTPPGPPRPEMTPGTAKLVAALLPRYAPCAVCAGARHCDPISALGRQRLWTWTP